MIIAPETKQTEKKELYAFSWPCDLMDRNVSDQEILEAYETEDGVEKLTPDELAAEINDNDCAFGQCYVRFIEVEELTMKRRIILVAGLHLTATDKAYINAILDAGQQTGHRKGGLHVTLQPTDKKSEK